MYRIQRYGQTVDLSVYLIDLKSTNPSGLSAILLLDLFRTPFRYLTTRPRPL